MFPRNHGFICLNCRTVNRPAKTSYRNHCLQCLYSRHVDDQTPGDRASLCQGLMPPISVDYTGKKGYLIIHRCLKCDKINKNKLAKDDNFEEVIGYSVNKDHSIFSP